MIIFHVACPITVCTPCSYRRLRCRPGYPVRHVSDVDGLSMATCFRRGNVAVVPGISKTFSLVSWSSSMSKSYKRRSKFPPPPFHPRLPALFSMRRFLFLLHFFLIHIWCVLGSGRTRRKDSLRRSRDPLNLRVRQGGNGDAVVLGACFGLSVSMPLGP